MSSLSLAPSHSSVGTDCGCPHRSTKYCRSRARCWKSLRIGCYSLLVGGLFSAFHFSSLTTTAKADQSIDSLIEEHSLSELASLEQEVPLDQLDSIREALWQKYQAEFANNADRLAEHEANRMQHGDATMRYAPFRVGEKPAEGYPLYIALHGGGSSPPQVNHSQWEHMKVYYRSSVQAGMYVATRGVSDTWNLHFRGESYPLYDRLIENMIALEDVDPNRVYVLGFSAGGDGVYQIGCRMPDRFAAANMSAGHPNGVNPRNLMNLPFLLQVGERDTAYQRHQQAARFHLSLDPLRETYGGGYLSELFVHHGRPHNFLDNDPRQREQTVISNPQAWLDEGDRTSHTTNTNAVAWLDEHRRNPWPSRVVWQIDTRAARPTSDQVDAATTIARHNLHYWISALGTDLEGVQQIDVQLDSEENQITVHQGANQLQLLLRREMLNFEEPISVVIEGNFVSLNVQPSLATMAQTLLQRGDPNYQFEVALVLERRENGRWRARQE